MSDQESRQPLAAVLSGGRTRRGFLVGAGAAVGCLALPSGAAEAAAVAAPAAHRHAVTSQQEVQAPPFEFKSEPHRLRKSVQDLTDAEVKTLCRAIGYMRNGSKEKPLNMDSPIQWDQYVMTHARHCTEAGWDQVHWSWFFLPWHRGYLFFLERTLASIVTLLGEDGSKFALPYWDWTNHPGVPNTSERLNQKKASPFFGYDLSIDNPDGDDLGFDNLALWDGYRGPTVEKNEMKVQNEIGPQWAGHTLQTLGAVSPAFIGGLFSLPFEVFGGLPTVDRNKGQGLLEQFPHNLVHDWLGSRWGKNRDMGTLRYAALDPLFNLHHANIDRIWSLYSYTPDPETLPGWGKQWFNFVDGDGKKVSVTVTDIIKQMTNVSYNPPAAEAQPLLAAAPAAKRQAPKGTTESVIEKPAELTPAPLTLPAPAGKPSLRALFKSATAPEHPSPAVLIFELGPISYPGRFSIRVFVNKPDADRNTSVEDPHFVGIITGLDSEARSSETNENVTNTFLLPISKGMSNFYNVVEPGQPFELTLVPLVPPSAADFHIKVKRVKVEVFQ